MMALGAGAAHAQASLDDAIQNAAENLSLNFETGTRIAVVSIQAGSDRMSGYLIDGTIDALVGAGRFAVVSRDEVELALVRGELDFNMSAEVDDETAQFIGRFFGAQVIATGALEPHGNAFRLMMRAIEVETAVIRGTHTEIVRNDRAVRYLLGNADHSRFWSLGVSGNFSTVELISGVPVAGVTVQGTLSPFRRSFIRVGSDFLFGRYSDDFYSTSIFPFVHYAFFLPFATIGGWHIGMGGGFMMTSFENWEGSGSDSFFAADLTTGFTVGWFSVSYTLRTNFSAFSDKISVGFVYRFRARGNR